jgi:hypothetical protein
MLKTGTTVLVSALALVALGGAVGYIDNAIALTANNGATVEQIDASSWNVTLINDGDTTLSAAAKADGIDISGETVATSGQPATVIQLTLSAASGP